MGGDALAEYRGCAGLPIDTGAWRRSLPYLPGEIDYEQPVAQMIRLTPRTAKHLYSAYTTRTTHYEPGTRPGLERFVDIAVGAARTDGEKVARILERIWRRLIWPHEIPSRMRELGGTEEDILERGYAYCNEASRVFVTLCQVAGIPARMTFHWTVDGRAGHSCAEAWFDGKWQLCDSDINVTGSSVPGAKASCWDLMRKKPLREAFDRIVTREMLAVIGHTGAKARYSDFFKLVGICNYPVADFPYNVRRMTGKAGRV